MSSEAFQNDTGTADQESFGLTGDLSKKVEQIFFSGGNQIVNRIAKVMNGASNEDIIFVIENISNEEIRREIAECIFGQKLAGDLGLRSTQDHPKTDYGTPHFGGAYDLGEK